MSPSDYNNQEFISGRLTPDMIRFFGALPKTAVNWKDLSIKIADFQKRNNLVADGMAGPKTREVLLVKLIQHSIKCWPMYGYKGRIPVVTSPYGPRGLKFHNGNDIFHLWLDEDPDDDVYGVRWEAGKRAGERWVWTPPECRTIISVAPGVIELCGTKKNGYRYWIDHREHGLDMCSGYLHLDEDTALVSQGAEVVAGQKLAKLWPKRDPPHLHYEELDSINPYRPRAPNLNNVRVIEP